MLVCCGRVRWERLKSEGMQCSCELYLEAVGRVCVLFQEVPLFGDILSFDGCLGDKLRVDLSSIR